MITLAENALPNIHQNSTLSGRLLSWWEAYGKHPNIAQFYQDEHGSCAVLLDNQAILVCNDASKEEFLSFFSLRNDIKKIYTDVKTARFFNLPFSCMEVMHCEQTASPLPLVSSTPQEIYNVLSTVFTNFPSFEPWYLDVSYRMRHNLCHQSSVIKDNALVSTAMTIAEWQNGALLGSVATLPEHRQKGYAAQCVLSLTAFFQQQGKEVYISPKNEKAKRLYKTLGFKEFETIALIERK